MDTVQLACKILAFAQQIEAAHGHFPVAPHNDHNKIITNLCQ